MAVDPRMTRHVKDVWPTLEELFAAGEQVQDVLQHPGFKAIVELVAAEIAEIDRDLAGRRKPATHEEYAMAHGRRGGLLAMHEAAEAILVRYEQRLTEQREQFERDAESSLSGRQ